MTVAFSGQTTVGTVAVQLGSQVIGGGGVCVKALPANAGTVYIGNNGASSVATTTGWPLKASEYVYFSGIANLADLWLIASAASQGVAWIALDV